MELYIKYLRHGTRVVTVQDSFKYLELESQLAFAYNYLSELTDLEIIEGFSDYIDPLSSGEFFDDEPSVYIHCMDLFDDDSNFGDQLYESSVYNDYWEFDAPGLKEFYDNYMTRQFVNAICEDEICHSET